MSSRAHGGPSGSRSSSSTGRAGAKANAGRAKGRSPAAAPAGTRTSSERRPSTRRPSESQRRRRPTPAAARRPGRRLRVAAILVVTLALAGGGYAAALDTSMFAFQNLVLVGGSSAVDSQVRAALAPELGRSLLRVSGAAVDREAAALPDVVSVRFVRSFPHTLRVFVTPERPVLLIRRGKVGFVVSARGRIMAESRDPLTSPLPRMWVGRGTLLSVGQTLHRTNGLLGAVAAAALKPGTIPGLRFVTVSGDQITLRTASGFQVRLGDNSALGLKLAIAKRIIAVVGTQISSNSYLDVSVPQRPVVGSSNSQLAGTG